MSFAKQLEHLRHAAHDPSHGDGMSMVRVRRSALTELLYHFDRLDQDVREKAVQRMVDVPDFIGDAIRNK